MNIFGFTVSRQKHAPVLSSPASSWGWWPVVREGFQGAWQRNIELRTENVLTFHAVYACVTLIASDIGKLRIKLVQQDANGLWTETDSPAFSPVLTKPNRYQTRIKFFEQWLVSKLVHGNTYILKQRDNRGIVVALYVLDAQRVKPLVAPDGSVYYQLHQDDLAQVDTGEMFVPASEIIHDVMVPLYHPLCGVSPITACGISAAHGLNIQRMSSKFFENGAQPGGLLTAPGPISAEDAKEVRRVWDSEYSGDNTGKVAVLGNGLTYEAMSVNAVDAQLIEQLKLTAEHVCSAFHVPSYMVGVGPSPSYNNIEALNAQYYSQCLQNLIESIEILLDEGLGLTGLKYGAEFDLDDLLRMDTPSRVKAAADSIGSGGMTINEAREKYFDLGPVEGGDSCYLQQQDFSVAALARRDAQADPFQFWSPTQTPPSLPQTPPSLPSPPEERSVTLNEVRYALFRATEKMYDTAGA